MVAAETAGVGAVVRTGHLPAREVGPGHPCPCPLDPVAALALGRLVDGLRGLVETVADLVHPPPVPLLEVRGLRPRPGPLAFTSSRPWLTFPRGTVTTGALDRPCCRPPCRWVCRWGISTSSGTPRTSDVAPRGPAPPRPLLILRRGLAFVSDPAFTASVWPGGRRLLRTLAFGPLPEEVVQRRPDPLHTSLCWRLPALPGASVCAAGVTGPQTGGRNLVRALPGAAPSRNSFETWPEVCETVAVSVPPRPARHASLDPLRRELPIRRRSWPSASAAKSSTPTRCSSTEAWTSYREADARGRDGIPTTSWTFGT